MTGRLQAQNEVENAQRLQQDMCALIFTCQCCHPGFLLCAGALGTRYGAGGIGPASSSPSAVIGALLPGLTHKLCPEGQVLLLNIEIACTLMTGVF